MPNPLNPLVSASWNSVHRDLWAIEWLAEDFVESTLLSLQPRFVVYIFRVPLNPKP